MKTPVVDARDHATRQYARQFDEFAETQQAYAIVVPELGAEAGRVAFWFLRAYRSELRNPMPGGRTTPVCCTQCVVYRSLPAEAKPVPLVEAIVDA